MWANISLITVRQIRREKNLIGHVLFSNFVLFLEKGFRQKDNDSNLFSSSNEISQMVLID